MNAEQIQGFQQVAETLRVNQQSNNESLQAVVQQMATQQEAMKILMEQNAQFLQNETKERKRESFIDTKAVGKPPQFSGKEAEWAGWAFKFTTWIAGQYEKGDEILEWAASLGEEEIMDEKITTKASEHAQIKTLN